MIWKAKLIVRVETYRSQGTEGERPMGGTRPSYLCVPFPRASTLKGQGRGAGEAPTGIQGGPISF